MTHPPTLRTPQNNLAAATFQYGVRRTDTLLFHEKGGKEHGLPAHPRIEAAVDAYIAAAGIQEYRIGPLFRTIGSRGELTTNRLQAREPLAMIKRKAAPAGLGTSLRCHSFRATGITLYMANGGTIETAAAIAAHEFPRTTKLYDRTASGATRDEIERVKF